MCFSINNNSPRRSAGSCSLERPKRNQTEGIDTMSTKVTCHNLNCEHNNIELDTCELESITLGCSGICVLVQSAADQEEELISVKIEEGKEQ